jgi:hypothetical protein
LSNPRNPRPLSRLIFFALYLLGPFDADQFYRGCSLATLLSTLPIRPQMLPPLHRFREGAFANVSHRFDPIVSQFAHEFLARETNIFDNLPQQKRRDITASVKRNSRASSIRMTILFMGAALTNFDKSPLFQNMSDLARLQYRQPS